MRVRMMLQQYQHILVPVDGSYEAELAFKGGCRRETERT